MKEVSCTRGFGLITDPQTGEEYNVAGANTVEVSNEIATRLKSNYSGVVISEVEPEEYTCGINECSRTVDAPEDTCWQH